MNLAICNGMNIKEYKTETIVDFGPLAWKKAGDTKLIGVANMDSDDFIDPELFSYGKGCLKHTQQGMKDGKIKLLFEDK